jgi:hypothetical protein
VFDPERDADDDRRHFLLRLGVIAAITVAGCLALWPSVTGFAGGPDHQIGCLAIADGWHRDKPHPSDAALQAAYAAYPPMPTEAQRNDPAFMERFRAQLSALAALPVVQAANAYANWASNTGACLHESRHRLIRSGIGLVGLTGFVAGVAYFLRTRENPHQAPQELAGV